MASLPETQRAARARLLDALVREVLGPTKPDEEISESPTGRYLVGRLAPSGTRLDVVEDDLETDQGEADGDGEADETGPVEVSVPLSMSMNPSSIGLSFVVLPESGNLKVRADWGEYESFQVMGEAKPQTRYRRTSRSCDLVVDPSTTSEIDTPVGDGVRLEGIVRRIADGRLAVSVFLVNRRLLPDAQGQPPPGLWLFQPSLRIEAEDGLACFAARRPGEVAKRADPEHRTAELVYRERPEIAAGHNCAADWAFGGPGAPVATAVWTSIVPAFELPAVNPSQSGNVDLDMRKLGGTAAEGVPAADLRAALEPLADDYRAWIGGLERDLLPTLAEELVEAAHEQIEACRIAESRMREGINLLQDDENVRRAFCFANRAMALQRERTVTGLLRRRGEPAPARVSVTWRPFQMAFILLTLPSSAEPTHHDRRVADLLWFPTGGGKTEAYLGLAAFMLAYRRVRPALKDGSNQAGVSVLMRYTLRLLTIQQFQRAATLICACEVLRKREGVWGRNPFGIGLWVGRGATPNDYATAKDVLTALWAGQRAYEGTPRQLLWCPWCGEDLVPRDYHLDDERERIFVRCHNEDCDFHASGALGLPVHMADDDIYRNLPSLVIATVDKFARMPWNGRVQALFGRVTQHCPRHGYLSAGEKHARSHNASGAAKAAECVNLPSELEPPDLIIQDELHLVSGPLGTLVGAYESAVDYLCGNPNLGPDLHPKIIASTATIRRARDQVRGIFERSVQLFPPQGLDFGDSYFGREVSIDESPGRLYVGIHAPGKSVKTALVRVYATLLSGAEVERQVEAEATDPYMTLIGYFNSLRELGGATRLIEDDIPARINVMRRRDEGWAPRRIFEREELTSNKKAEQIPEILAKLERRFGAGAPEPGKYPVDVLLASNMISVGVDIDRIGLMVVNGQPKTTAEYIQATSRVGRQPPGLVVTVYNWTRPRDISHYERFRSYHSMLYRFVEATGVTPFSSRARDRALAPVLAAIVRLGGFDMTWEQTAGDIGASMAAAQAAIAAVVDRARRVAGDDVAEATEAEMTARLDTWIVAAQGSPLCYTRRGVGNDETKRFLLGALEQRENGVFAAPGSLREVETELHVYLAGDQA